MLTLLLASKSPRRRQLLAELGFPVRFVDIDVNEVVDPSLPVSQIPEQLAVLKASAYPVEQLEDNQVLVTADTIVALDGRHIGKPGTPQQAVEMLRALSGRRHTVYSGVCLTMRTVRRTFTESSDVYFKPLTDEMISYYVEHYSPLDKAGAYGIQDWIGMVGVSRIDGCFYNVMGLPLARLYYELQQLG
ncbi:MAG: Maf family protein [Bacteroidales bacterium]|nr:Maf family protein [Bacteroidales bacterium]